MIMGRWCHNPDRGVQGDNSCVPCISYRKKASGKKTKKQMRFFFRLYYGNAANQGDLMIMGRWYHNPDRGVQGDNSCVPCISYKKNASMVKKK